MLICLVLIARQLNVTRAIIIEKKTLYFVNQGVTEKGTIQIMLVRHTPLKYILIIVCSYQREDVVVSNSRRAQVNKVILFHF